MKLDIEWIGDPKARRYSGVERINWLVPGPMPRQDVTGGDPNLSDGVLYVNLGEVRAIRLVSDEQFRQESEYEQIIELLNGAGGGYGSYQSPVQTLMRLLDRKQAR